MKLTVTSHKAQESEHHMHILGMYLKFWGANGAPVAGVEIKITKQIRL